MKKMSSLACLFLATLPAGAVPQAKVGGAQFSLVEWGHGPERKVKGALKGPTQLRLHLKAIQQPCTLVVSGFLSPGAGRSPDFPPQVLELTAGEAKDLSFKVDDKLKPTRLYVALIKKPTLVKMAKDWAVDPAHQDPARKTLYNRLSQCYNAQDLKTRHSGPLPPALGGATSQSAYSANPSLRDDKLKEVSATPSRASNELGDDESSVDWTKDAEFLVCQGDTPAVYIYQVSMTRR